MHFILDTFTFMKFEPPYIHWKLVLSNTHVTTQYRPYHNPSVGEQDVIRKSSERTMPALAVIGGRRGRKTSVPGARCASAARGARSPA